MRAVQLHGKGDLRLADVPRPGALKAGEVRVKVEAAGICGSDIHNYRTGQWISRTPSIPGHELSGVITETGPGAGHFNVGDLVVADSRYWCGTCEACRTGKHHLCQSIGFVGEVCDGGFAEETVLPARLLLKADQGLPADVAATAEPLAVALHAVARLAPVQGETILVTGCGMIGALVALVLSRKGAVSVRVADRNLARAELVAEVTGAVAVGVDQPGLAGISGLVEATGSSPLLRHLVDVVPGGSRIALVGIFHGHMDLDPTILVERELALVGCHAFADELTEAVRLLPHLKDEILQFLSEPIRLDEVPEAYARIIAGEMKAPKTIIRP